MREFESYGMRLPGVDPRDLLGWLVVIEGTDGVGRTTHVKRLRAHLEQLGYAVAEAGLNRSELASPGIKRAKLGNTLGTTAFNLFYATDFADQLENIILPSLRAGFIVLADRYIYTLMARAMVRELDEAWLHNLYGIALVPDAVFYLNVSPEQLVQRNFAKTHSLDYWESGMDLGLTRDMFDSFLKYQSLVEQRFKRLQAFYGFEIINANRGTDEIHAELQQKLALVLSGRSA